MSLYSFSFKIVEIFLLSYISLSKFLRTTISLELNKNKN